MDFQAAMNDSLPHLLVDNDLASLLSSSAVTLRHEDTSTSTTISNNSTSSPKSTSEQRKPQRPSSLNVPTNSVSSADTVQENLVDLDDDLPATPVAAVDTPAEQADPSAAAMPLSAAAEVGAGDANPPSLSPLTTSEAPTTAVDQQPAEEFSSDCYAIGNATNEPTDYAFDMPLGTFKPFWIPDSEAEFCMSCEQRFTMIRRRHHCRACGKVLCANCCSMRARLLYLDNKEDRVCNQCYAQLAMQHALEEERLHSLDRNHHHHHHHTVVDSPNHQAAAAATTAMPPIALVPGKSSIKRHDRPRPENCDRPKQVVFADGIRPGGDLTEELSTPTSQQLGKRSGHKRISSPQTETPSSSRSHHHHSSGRKRHNRTTVSDSTGPLPPIINSKDLAANNTIDNLIACLRDDSKAPIVFYLCKNLHVIVKLVTLDCCQSGEVWSFASQGLGAVGQDELAIVLARQDEDITVDTITFPRDVFRLLTSIYDSAMRGTVYSAMSHVLFPEGLFNCKENSGFMFVRPTFQCMANIVVPPTPYLVALLIHKFEVPWAKLFPLRLLLRLGAEYRTYPFPLISYRQRKPAYYEVGHTLLNVLADFRNFQYTLPVISGLLVHRKLKKTSVILPRNRYDRIAKVLGSSNEHVLAFGANFSLEADSHLTCQQNDEGQHQTHLVLKNADQELEPALTGASFIVFSGALKSTTGLTAKMSVVEDGILVQIPATSMEALKTALRDMKDYEVACGKIEAEQPDEIVAFEWIDNDTYFNVGVRSPIDSRSLEGINSVRIYNGTDFTGAKYLIRWTEVFFIDDHNDDPSRRMDVDPAKLAAVISQAFCISLVPHLEDLIEKGLQKVALRVSLDTDKIGYEAGAAGQPLPEAYANELDAALIPVIMGNVVTALEGLLVMELFFYILLK